VIEVAVSAIFEVSIDVVVDDGRTVVALKRMELPTVPLY
jgi:hypothetical protein